MGDTNQTIQELIRLASSLQHTTVKPLPSRKRPAKKNQYRGLIEQVWLHKYKRIL
jgi:hypothetical protein